MDIGTKLHAWEPAQLHAVEDCGQYVEAGFSQTGEVTKDTRDLFTALVGKWVALNVLGRAPETDDECNFAYAAGNLAVTGFLSWWET
jgi:hypothetical protein